MGVEIIQARGDKREREVGGWECDKIKCPTKNLGAGEAWKDGAQSQAPSAMGPGPEEGWGLVRQF